MTLAELLLFCGFANMNQQKINYQTPTMPVSSGSGEESINGFLKQEPRSKRGMYGYLSTSISLLCRWSLFGEGDLQFGYLMRVVATGRV